MLFTEMTRDSEDAKGMAESDYDYLNRSARAEAVCIRSVLDDWASRYPETGSADLVGRFQSPIDAAHTSAAFELYIHELLLSLGYSIEVHPHTPTERETRPDFRVIDQSRENFYVEAVLSHEHSEEEQAAEQRLADVRNTVNRLESHNFFISLEDFGRPETPPSGRKFRNQVRKWLEGLDPDNVIAEYRDRGPDALPEMTFEHDGWEVRVTAIPRSPEARHRAARSVIGSFGDGTAGMLMTAEQIRDSLNKKSKKYGQLDAPLIVAANVITTHIDRIDEANALFGDEQVIVDVNDLDAPPREGRAPNGFWVGPKGPRNCHTAGVIIADCLRPWTFASHGLTFYRNPWTDSPVGGSISRLPLAQVVNERLQISEGESPADILNLPGDYPGRSRADG